MKDILHIAQVLWAAVGGSIGWFLGGMDGLVYALLIFLTIDYITGLMSAVLERKLSSRVGFKGIFKKMLILAFVGIGNVLDLYVLEQGSAIRIAVIFFYLANEGISIIENSSMIGLPVPEKLKLLFQEIQSKGDNK